MRSLFAFAALLALLVGALFLALTLDGDDASWLVFQDGPNLYTALAEQGLLTPDGLFDADGLPVANFVIVTPPEGSKPQSAEGYFRSHGVAERYFGSNVLLPDKMPSDWHRAAIRVVERDDERVVQTEYQNARSGAHILASQAGSTTTFELPGRGIARSEHHSVKGLDVSVHWLSLERGGRLVAFWVRRGRFLTATLSTEGSGDLETMLDFVALTAR